MEGSLDELLEHIGLVYHVSIRQSKSDSLMTNVFMSDIKWN